MVDVLVVFGTLTILDQFAGIILSLIPFYYVLKVSLLIWMFHPSTLGSLTLYDNFILPALKQYQGKIDAFHEELETQYKQATKFAKDKAGELTSTKETKAD